MLFDAIEIGGIDLKNRVVMSPMCMYNAAHDAKATHFHMEHYASRAAGGVGLVMLEATAVCADGRISDRDLGLWNDVQMISLSHIVERIHSYDCKVGIQLAHAGRKSEAATTPFAPSALRFSENYRMPKEMRIQDIVQIKQQFLDACKRAESIGFDVIEIHAAHGYLLHEFLSPFSNKREDDYGGSFANRARFLLEIVKELRTFYTGALFVRLSAVEYQDVVCGLEESIALARLLKDLGVDLIDVSSGGNSPKLPSQIFSGYQIEYAKAIKESAHMKTAAVGMIDSYELAEKTLTQGAADLIFLGRELLRNPYWVANNAYQYEKKNFMLKNYTRAY
ncbi:MAG: NADH:flavin oxidoreductase/NADH oxidase [Sulfurospirillum sp.]|nr:NADH:flavin oxidoreductase/NADH oxidase [Sulfurospirillum sp.]